MWQVPSPRVAVCIAGVAVLSLAGCETAPKPARNEKSPVAQQIAIDTPGVPGAQCSLSAVTIGRQTVTTPASLEVDRSPEIIVVLCRKPCYLDTSAMITPEGVRRPDGQVIYSYPAETALTMRPANRCDAPAGPRTLAP
ncbi:MAG: hypothetical protein ACK4MF_08230 [Hyphomicrobiaceae bacterium]